MKNSCTAIATILLHFSPAMAATAQRPAPTKVAQGYGAATAPAPHPATPAAASAKSEPEAHAAATLSGKRWSLSVVLPNYATSPVANAAGLRYAFSDEWMGSGYLVFSNNTDNTKDKSLFGVVGKIQRFVGGFERARPYLGASVYMWKPSGDANKPNTDSANGLNGFLGAEVWFIPEFSVYLETGLFVDTSNIEKAETEVGTFTSGLGINVNFDLE